MSFDVEHRQKEADQLPAFEMEFDNDAKVRVMFDFTGDWASLLKEETQDIAEDSFVLAVATLVAQRVL